MLRKILARHYREMSEEGFRWRGHEISRVEGLSDAVFGFAITLLIVSLEVPKTSSELFETMRGFTAFVVTFVMLTGIWRAQFVFFRRYGLEDNVTVYLNLGLLFMVLFFVYPLKFLFGVMVTDPTLRHLKVPTEHGLQLAVLPEHRAWIFFIFGVGFAAIFLLFVLMYAHAYQKREELGLNELEIFETRFSIRRQLCAVAIGISYFGLAAVMNLPEKTRSEKLIAITADLGILAMMLGFLFYMFRLQQKRRSFVTEWKSRNGQASIH